MYPARTDCDLLVPIEIPIHVMQYVLMLCFLFVVIQHTVCIYSIWIGLGCEISENVCLPQEETLAMIASGSHLKIITIKFSNSPIIS